MWWPYDSYGLKVRILYTQQNYNFVVEGDFLQRLYFKWANSSRTIGSALLQLCCIITDSKLFLRHNKQINHWLKWDKFFIEGTNYDSGDVPKGQEILLCQDKLHIYCQLG